MIRRLLWEEIQDGQVEVGKASAGMAWLRQDSGVRTGGS